MLGVAMRSPLPALLPIVVACSAAGPPPGGSRAPAPVDTAAPEPAPSLDPAPGVEGPVPEACRGADLDLDVLAGWRACDVVRQANAPPPAESVGVELSLASPSVKPGETVEVTVAIVNRTAGPVGLDLDLGCGKKHQFEMEALPARGERAASIPARCSGIDMGCSLRTIHMALEPGGRIHTQLAFAASVMKAGDRCDRTPTGPLQPGTYTLQVGTPLKDRDARHVGEVHPRTAQVPLVVAR
jgi:hypothetical protein